MKIIFYFYNFLFFILIILSCSDSENSTNNCKTDKGLPIYTITAEGKLNTSYEYKSITEEI